MAEWTEADQARADLIADIACEISESDDVVAMALDAYDARVWQPASTLPTKKGMHVLVNDRRFGVGEAMLFDNGDWGLASFNGQIIKAEPLEWCAIPARPATVSGDKTDA